MPHDVNYSEIRLSIGFRFALFTGRPAVLPDHIEAIPEALLPEQVVTRARLANDPISDVALADPHPYLILTFKSGRALFLHGYDRSPHFPCTVQRI